MEFKEYLKLKDGEFLFFLVEPITINNDERFVRIEYYLDGTDKNIKEDMILNCDMIKFGK